MAAPSYTTDLATHTDCSATTGFAEATGMTGTDGTGIVDSDLAIYGTVCISESQRKSGLGSLVYTGTAQTLPTDGGFFVWYKFFAPNSLDTKANGGIRIVVGSSSANYRGWYANGSDTYPYGGWVNYVVDPRETGSASQTQGTPTTSYATVGFGASLLTGISKGNSHTLDHIRWGRGEAIVTDGDIGNGYAIFDGLAIVNDNPTTGRWGLFQDVGGSYLWKGLMSLGTAATSVDFRDANVAITIDNTEFVSAAFNKIEVNHASSNIEWTSINISSLSTQALGNFEAVANATITKDGCTFTDMGTFIYQSNSTLTSSTWRRCGLVTQGGATFDGCIFDAATGAVALEATTLAAITDCVFNSDGTGHGIEITVAGTYNFSGNIFSGYGATTTTDAMIYNNSGGLVTINILDAGTVVTYRNGTSATTVVNNAVQILLQGVTEGAAVKIIANETVGTITTGDIIIEELADSNGEVATAIDYEGAFEPSGLDVITRVRSSGLPTAAIQDDNGVFTDETTAANQANTLVMNLLPTTPVSGEDRYLFGHPEKFNNMKIAINTAGTGGFTITWQYWNGAWTNLTGVVDDTSSFSVLGTNYISFTMPGDWTTTTINSQGPYFYIRAAYTAGTVTVTPLGTRCSLDVTKYLPFVQDGTVTSAGLTVTASWNEDTIATF